jgi:glycosyltransferase involved in cell wall biosynthesis
VADEQTLAAPAEPAEGRFEPLPGAVPAAPTVALVPAGGEAFEDFLDTIGVPLEQFCREGPGGWMLGYAEALRVAGLRTAIVLFSRRWTAMVRFRDPRSGTLISVLPVSRTYRALQDLGPTYQAVRRGKAGTRLARWSGALLTIMSTPLGALAAELRALGTTAILAQEYEEFRFNACVALGRRMGLPVFATFQGSAWDQNPLTRRSKASALRDAAGLFIAPGGEIERVRTSYGQAVATWQVFNPVDLDDWHGRERAEARLALGLDEATRVVVWHGRIALHDKGLDVLLEAWSRLVSERGEANLRLMLLGTGEDAAAFRAGLAALGTTTITWIDRYETDRSRIRRFLAAGDLYVFPSRLEGFAVAPIEAMACGLPIVAAAASGVRDILPAGCPAGIVVEPGDAGTLAAALGAMLDDPALPERGAAARRRVEEAFSPAAVSAVLKQAIDGAARGRGTAA